MGNIALRTENLCRNFGAVSAVKDMSLAIEQGSFHAVIGPNGAGKTTFLDLIVNRTKPTSGKVYMFDRDITGMKPHRIVENGLCKCYQICQLFPQLSCYENVLVSMLRRKGQAFDFRPRRNDYLKQECLEQLERVGIAGLADEKATYLSYGDQKRLEIAMVLAAEPKILLLDEPTQGVARAEGYKIMEMLHALNSKRDYTVVFIEHDMDIVFNYADMITVMDHGMEAATDTPANIRENKAVSAAYLGGA